MGRGSQRDAYRAVPHEQRHHGVVLAGTPALRPSCVPLCCAGLTASYRGRRVVNWHGRHWRCSLRRVAGRSNTGQCGWACASATEVKELSRRQNKPAAWRIELPTSCCDQVQELYGGRLAAHESVAGHTMAGVAGATAAAAELPVLLLIDTTGCDMEEQQEEEGDSKVRVVAEQGRLMCGLLSAAPLGCTLWALPGRAHNLPFHATS